MSRRELEELRDSWKAAWPDALALWSPFTRLRDPLWCLTADDEEREGLTGSFAMIRLADQSVVISLRQIAAKGIAAFPREVLGHEIGHHILCPADLSDNARLLARVRRALPTVEEHAPLIANLYADLLINDRLQRSRGLDMAGVYVALGGAGDPLWTFYMRMYEILWSRPRGTLAKGKVDARTEGDAGLGARLVRSFAGRWLGGASSFGALCLPYLLDQSSEAGAEAWRIWQDAVTAGAGGFPDGLTELGEGEGDTVLHPALDPTLNGGHPVPEPATSEPVEPADAAAQQAQGQYREPFEYGQILRASGLDIDDHQVAVRYYRERASRQLIPFPSRRAPVATDPLPEGVETWDVGSPLADVDWFESILRSPSVVPGITTVQRTWGTSTGGDPDRIPLDLDVYVDSSGSMPNPQYTVSYLTLAGAIVALSALRAGASVQVTLWSGTNEFTTTRGFVRDEAAILGVLTGFFGGATAFPIHVLRDTYAARPREARPAHVLVISDEGVTTMFDLDEAGRNGREVSRHAIDAAGGGATMVLNLWQTIEQTDRLGEAREDGWDIHAVRDWAELVAFAKAFSRKHYVDEAAPTTLVRS